MKNVMGLLCLLGMVLFGCTEESDIIQDNPDSKELILGKSKPVSSGFTSFDVFLDRRSKMAEYFGVNPETLSPSQTVFLERRFELLAKKISEIENTMRKGIECDCQIEVKEINLVGDMFADNAFELGINTAPDFECELFCDPINAAYNVFWELDPSCNYTYFGCGGEPSDLLLPSGLPNDDFVDFGCPVEISGSFPVTASAVLFGSPEDCGLSSTFAAPSLGSYVDVRLRCCDPHDIDPRDGCQNLPACYYSSVYRLEFDGNSPGTTINIPFDCGCNPI